jgi:hypothetical protein
LGAQIDFYGTLHSWGDKLWQHLLLPLIVPAGAIGGKGQWIKPKYKDQPVLPAWIPAFAGMTIFGV